MKIETVSIASFSRAKYNPRKTLKPGDLAYERLKKAIDTFGLVEPLVLNARTKTLVSGHQRLSILEERGYSEVEVSVVDLDEKQEKALNLALNKQGGEWDFATLADLLSELDAGDLDMELTGFGADELEKLMIWTPPNKGKSPKDQVPEEPKIAATKTGDLWILGNHRLLCGDSTSMADVSRLMADCRADLFATDPPYLVDYTGADRPNESGKDWTGSYREIEIKDAGQFFRSMFTAAIAVTAQDAAWYCWHAHKRAALIESIWEELDVLNHQQIVWVKPSALHGYSYWPWQHEPCLMGWRRGFKPKHDGDNSHAITSVWSVGWEGANRIVGNEHPTQKPTELFSIPMNKHTQPGEICYEPFSGSGSQIIAGEITGRRVFAMEISPIFVDVAVKRWEDFSGKKAELAK